jgi:superfamily II DNA or RNA helicase
MIDLRDYQQDCIGGVRGAYRTGKRSPLLVSPTGSGKTVMFAYIADGTSKKGNKVLILVHRQELVDQTCKTLRAFRVDHGVIAAGRSPDRSHSVQVASVQTLVRRLDFFRPDLIIIDEAHHGTAGSWRKVIDHNPQARVLGVTATPERLDGRGLKEVFDDLILGPEVRDLIRNGHLSPPVYFAPPQSADLSHLRISRGDFDQREMAEVMDNKAITGDAVEHYARICPGAPAVAFCASVKHAEHVAEQFAAAGFPASTIDGNMDRDRRREVVNMLGDGRLKVLTSCEIINEGFDLPVVSAAILLRPTMSLGLHLQQIGRVLRISPGKDRAYILDHVGNLARHGLAEDSREWSLDGRKKKKKKKGDEEEGPDVRQCPTCYCCHAPAPTCPQCGHTYEVKERKIEVVDGTLEMVAGIIDEKSRRCECGNIHSRWDHKCPACQKFTDPVRQRKAEQAGAQTIEDLIAIGRQRGYKSPASWAKHVFHARQGKRGEYQSQR